MYCTYRWAIWHRVEYDIMSYVRYANVLVNGLIVLQPMWFSEIWSSDVIVFRFVTFHWSLGHFLWTEMSQPAFNLHLLKIWNVITHYYPNVDGGLAYQTMTGSWSMDAKWHIHYNDVIMSTMASRITSLTTVYSTVYSGADQRQHQSSVSLAFVWGIHRGPVNSQHKWAATRKMFPFDDVIMSQKTEELMICTWPNVRVINWMA